MIKAGSENGAPSKLFPLVPSGAGAPFSELVFCYNFPNLTKSKNKIKIIVFYRFKKHRGGETINYECPYCGSVHPHKVNECRKCGGQIDEQSGHGMISTEKPATVIHMCSGCGDCGCTTQPNSPTDQEIS